MPYQCPKCQEVYSEEDLNFEDCGGYEDSMGTKVWKPCLIYTTPCCGVEPEEKEDLEDEQD